MTPIVIGIHLVRRADSSHCWAYMSVELLTKTERLHLHLSHEERERVVRLAAGRGMTISAMLLELAAREDSSPPNKRNAAPAKSRRVAPRRSNASAKPKLYAVPDPPRSDAALSTEALAQQLDSQGHTYAAQALRSAAVAAKLYVQPRRAARLSLRDQAERAGAARDRRRHELHWLRHLDLEALRLPPKAFLARMAAEQRVREHVRTRVRRPAFMRASPLRRSRRAPWRRRAARGTSSLDPPPAPPPPDTGALGASAPVDDSARRAQHDRGLP